MIVYQRVPQISFFFVTLLTMKGIPQPYFGNLVTMVFKHLHPLGAHPPVSICQISKKNLPNSGGDLVVLVRWVLGVSFTGRKIG